MNLKIISIILVLVGISALINNPQTLASSNMGLRSALLLKNLKMTCKHRCLKLVAPSHLSRACTSMNETALSGTLNLQRYYSSDSNVNCGSWDQVYELAKTLEDQIKNPDTSLRDYKIYPQIFGIEIPIFGVGLPKFFIETVENATNPIKSRFVSEATFNKIKEVNRFKGEEHTENLEDVYEWIKRDGPWVIKVHIADKPIDRLYTEEDNPLGHSFVLEKWKEGLYYLYQSNNKDSLLSFMNKAEEMDSRSIESNDFEELMADLDFLLDEPRVWTKEKLNVLLTLKRKTDFSLENIVIPPLEFQASFSY